MDVELRYLATFAAVCEEGGFNKASKKLHLTQPAVSYQVKMLERQLGVRLLERAGRSLIITAEGKMLRDYCRRFFADFSLIRTQFKEDLSLREPLRIASVSGFGRFALFPFLCQPQYRHLRFDLRFPTEIEVLQKVETGDCDLGFIYEIRVSNYLQFTPVYEELVLVAPAQFRKKEFDLKKLKTYETLPMITYEEGHYVFGQWFDAYFKKQPGSVISVHHFEELEEVVEMIRLNRGFSILPDHAVASAAKNRHLQIIKPLANKKCTNIIYAVTRSGAPVRNEINEIIGGLTDS